MSLERKRPGPVRCLEITEREERVSGYSLQLYLVVRIETWLNRGFYRTLHIIKCALQRDLCELLLNYSYLGDPRSLTCGPVNLSLNITGMHFYLVSTFLIPLKFYMIFLEGKFLKLVLVQIIVPAVTGWGSTGLMRSVRYFSSSFCTWGSMSQKGFEAERRPKAQND